METGRKIKNREELLSHGDRESRKIVLDIAEGTLERLDARRRIGGMIRREGSVITIGKKSWDLDRYRHIYLIGAGKAANHMAMAIDETLGDRLTRGIAIVKIKEETDIFRRTEVYAGGHPIPNEDGYRASLQILEMVEGMGPEDLVFAVMSGGSSALMSCPIEGISLEEEREATDVLLKSGASIREINAVRRHISRMNGGMLAKRIAARGAELIGFNISDAVGKAPTGDITIPVPNMTATPIGVDDTTLEDARMMIRNYNLEDKLPRTVTEYLEKAGPEGETPKAFPGNTYYRINTLPDSCLEAKRVSEEMGIPCVILTSFLEGESKDAGTFLASLARQIKEYHTPFKPPCVLAASGEVTTSIPDSSVIAGHGGPGQELAVSFALAAEKVPGACILSIDSEGTDGTSPAAGGMTDSTGAAKAREMGISLYDALREHACYEALERMGDAVMTGNTGTNLCDLHILYIPD